MKKAYLILTLVLIPFLGFNQKFAFGGSGLYNVQSESFGAGARVSILPNSTFSIIPQFSYFLAGPVNEWTAGVSLEVKIIKKENINYYILGHGGYNNWLNPEASAMPGAQSANVNAELGVGIVGTRCLRPFLEYRYNLNFRETHFQLGFLYIFGCTYNNNSGYRSRSRMKSRVKCATHR